MAPSDEGAGERSETEGEKKLHFLVALHLLSLRHGKAVPPSRLPTRSVLLSLRLEIAAGNPHPRQREARIVETPTFRIEPKFNYVSRLKLALLITVGTGVLDRPRLTSNIYRLNNVFAYFFGTMWASSPT